MTDDGDGVVDQEQADEQRDPRQRRQVEVERAQHPLDLRAAPRRPLDRATRRAVACRSPLSRVDVRAVREPDLDAIEAAEPIERPLRRGDVHQDEVAVEHARRAVILQQPSDHERAASIADVELDSIARREGRGGPRRPR